MSNVQTTSYGEIEVTVDVPREAVLELADYHDLKVISTEIMGDQLFDFLEDNGNYDAIPDAFLKYISRYGGPEARAYLHDNQPTDMSDEVLDGFLFSKPDISKFSLTELLAEVIRRAQNG